MEQEYQKYALDFIKANAGSLQGMQTVGQSLNDYSPFKVEQLSRTVVDLTAGTDRFRVYQTIPKKTAYGNVIQVAKRLSYSGVNRYSPFVAEGVVPSVNNENTITQQSIRIAIILELRRITHMAQNVQMVGNLNTVADQTLTGTKAVMETLSNAIINGDTNVVPLGIAGIKQQAADLSVFGTIDNYQFGDNVIDKRGSTLQTSDINNALNRVVTIGFGDPSATKVLASPAIYTTYANSLQSNASSQQVQQYVISGNGANGANPGISLMGFTTALSPRPLEYISDQFSRRGQFRRITDLATSTLAPAAPTVPAITISNVPADLAKFSAAEAGTYVYAVASVNGYGESALLLVSAAQAVALNDTVNIGFTNSASTGDAAATGYTIYRSERNSVDGRLYPIFSVSNAQKAAGFDGAAVNLVRDRNRYIAGTDDAYVLQWDSDSLELHEMLGGIVKQDIPQSNFIGVGFAVLSYSQLACYSALRIVKIQNVAIK